MRLTRLDIAMGIAVAFTWGMGIVVAKAAIDHFPPILLMSLRFTVTALALVWFVKPPVWALGRICGIAIISAAIQYSLTFTGMLGLDASVTALVVQLEVPFLVLFGVLFLKEQPSVRKWFGIAMAFGGVMLIAGEPKLNGAWSSMFMVVGGACAWAFGQILIRKLKEIDGITMTAWVAVFAAPQLLIMSLVFEENHMQAMTSAGWVVWGTVLYLGLIMTAAGYGLWYTLLRRHPVNMVAPFLLLLPVFSVIGGVLFLGETLSLQVMAGGAIVIAGVAAILIERGGQKEACPEV
ncbi:DMT family transporter [Pelagibius sp. Alg239-R121]|uniref:DMT family transporter n=1 Tax=Pelagibius sp. Alg239-R121 TaxID=2993448 RepID=UPI0024A70CE4|nr:EamA family transporter [Pelagibius sp. Alg239-R121]